MGREAQRIMAKQGLCRFGRGFESQVAPAHQSATIEGIDPGVRNLVQQAIERDNKGILLMGPVGCGKTSVMALALKSYLLKAEIYFEQRFQSGAYVEAGNGMYENIESGGFGSIHAYPDYWYGTHADIIRELRDWNVGVEANQRDMIPSAISKSRIYIDDFGRVYSDKSGWNMSLQEEYFDFLWRNRRRVFVTTNITPEEFNRVRKNNSEWSRIYDRLYDSSWVTRIVMANKSKRGG